MNPSTNTWMLTDGRHSVHLSDREIKALHSLVSVALSIVEPDKVPLVGCITRPNAGTLQSLLAKLIAVMTIIELKEAR